VDPHHGKQIPKWSGIVQFWNEISCPHKGYKKVIMVTSFVGGNGLSTLETNDNILWQLELHKYGKESCFACMHQTHWNGLSFYMWPN
jgi:hypothetical protein